MRVECRLGARPIVARVGPLRSEQHLLAFVFSAVSVVAPALPPETGLPLRTGCRSPPLNYPAEQTTGFSRPSLLYRDQESEERAKVAGPNS